MNQSGPRSPKDPKSMIVLRESSRKRTSLGQGAPGIQINDFQATRLPENQPGNSEVSLVKYEHFDIGYPPTIYFLCEISTFWHWMAPKPTFSLWNINLLTADQPWPLTSPGPDWFVSLRIRLRKSLIWTHGAPWPRPVRFLKDSIKKITDLETWSSQV